MQRCSLDKEWNFCRLFFEFRKRSIFTQKRFSLGHWSCLGPGEDNSYGTRTCNSERQWNMIVDVMVDTFKESGHPVFRGTNALNRGFLKREGGRCTIHFNAESSKPDLLFRTIHSANQLSICGAVASWCEELAQLILGPTHLSMEKSVAKVNDQLPQKLEPQELDTSVQTPRRNDEASGDRLRIHHQRFEDLSNEIQITKACESAGFIKRVSIGMYYKTLQDVNDGFWRYDRSMQRVFITFITS